MDWKYDVAVIGAGGRVGLPLSLAFADSGLRVVGIEIDKSKLAALSEGTMPFDEPGCAEILEEQLSSLEERLVFTDDYNLTETCEYLIIVPGTPLTVDNTPDSEELRNVFGNLIPHIRPGHVIVLRSTVAPRTTETIREFLRSSIDSNLFGAIEVAVAPERIVEGRAIRELHELPQIIGAFSQEAYEKVSSLFTRFGIETLQCRPIEAELAKLFANNFRYIQFAIANEFFMICENLGVSFESVRNITNYEYPRSSITKSGFARGPCLGKDSWLLMSTGAGHPLQSRMLMSSYLVNETLPDFVVAIAKNRLGSFSGKNVLVLGLTFKRDSDDIRSSLSPKLISLIESEFVGRLDVHDPFVEPDNLEKKLSRADIIFVATNHSIYDHLALSNRVKPDCLIVDVWYQLNPKMGHSYYCRDIQ